MVGLARGQNISLVELVHELAHLPPALPRVKAYGHQL